MSKSTRIAAKSARWIPKVRSSNEVRRVRHVLVAGGAGFLGSRLCARYLERGCAVTALDNLLTGRLKNIAPLMDDPGFRFVQADITDMPSFETRFDLIYNMACPASPPRYQADPIHTLKTNLYGVMNLLDLALKCDARILQSSTSEVYGDPDISPQPESYWGNVNTVGPRSCYDEGKRVAETIFYEYHKQHGLDVRLARIFNAYGPGMDPDDGRVVSNFITQALRGDPITIYGDGSQSRSFCFLDDMVDGLMALMHAKVNPSKPVNIGNPVEFTMLELAELVLSKVPSKSRLKFCDLPQDDPKQRRPDISRARRRLGWAPRVSLAEGLDPTIDYFAREIMGLRARAKSAVV